MISFKYKVLLLGEPECGKTSLMRRFVSDVFKKNYATTIGAQILTKEVSIGADDLNDDVVQLNIWDIAGQKKFFDLRTTFYLGAQGALLVFDLTRRTTLEEVNVWYKELTPVLGRDFPIILIGNKSDLKERKVKATEAKQFAKAKNWIYLETSAMTGENVEKAFWELARLVATKVGGVKITKKIVKKKVKIASKEKGGASYIVKTRLQDYVKAKGFNVSKDIINGNELNRIVVEILDKAIENAQSEGRKTVQPKDIK